MNAAIYQFLRWINSWAGNWGLAIIIFTVLIRLVMTPLDFKSRKSMRRTTALQPKLAALQKKYANDKEKLNQKTAELYKKEGINPLSSCLPMLLTWPILIIVFNAMRTVANEEILRQVTQIVNGAQPELNPFLWIRNLWMPDNPFSPAWPDLNTLRMISADQWKQWFAAFGGEVPAMLQGLSLTAESFDGANLMTTIQSIQAAMLEGSAEYAAALTANRELTFNLLITTVTVMNNYNGFLLLPILSAGSQLLMTKLTGAQQNTAQPAANDQSAMTSKMMNWFFPLFSLVICINYSSAFALYWVAGNVVMLVQTLVINKILDDREKKGQAAGEDTVK